MKKLQWQNNLLKIVQLWEIVQISLIICGIIIQTTVIVYSSQIENFHNFLKICDVFFILNMFMECITPKVETNGKLNLNLMYNLKKYCKCFFIIDFGLCMPVPLIFQIVYANSSYNNYYVALSGSIRFLRIYKVIRYFYTTSQNMIKSTIIYCICGFVILYTFSSIWFFIACYGFHGFKDYVICKKKSWINQTNSNRNSTVASIITSLYWATATFTTTGYGDILYQNLTELWFVILAMITCMLCVSAFIIGKVTSNITHTDMKKYEFLEKLNCFIKKLEILDISRELLDKIENYYEYRWQNKILMQETHVYEMLTEQSKQKINYTIAKGVLEKMIMFVNLEDFFISKVISFLQHEIYMTGENIMIAQQIGKRCIYIKSGIVAMLKDDKIIHKIKEGDVIGQIDLIYDVPRKYTLQAITNVQVVVLKRTNKLINLLKESPEFQYNVRNIRKNMNFNNTVTDQQMKLLKREPLNNILKYLNCTQLHYSFITKKENSKIKIFFKKLLKNFTNSNQRCVDIFITTCAILTVLIQIYSIGFDKYQSQSIYSRILTSTLIILDGIHWIYIIFQIIKCYEKVSTYSKKYCPTIFALIKQYGYFKIQCDVLSILPIQAICLLLKFDEYSIYIGGVNRILRVSCVYFYFKKMESKLRENTIYRYAKFLTYIILISQFIAALLFITTCFKESCDKTSWLILWLKKTRFMDNLNHLSYTSRYIISLYFATSATSSVGYGDVSSKASSDRFFSICAMIFGFFIYTYALASITSHYTNLNSFKVEFISRIKKMKNFINHTKLNKKLAQDTMCQLNLFWNTHENKKSNYKAEFDYLPKSLSKNIALEICDKVFYKIDFFKNFSHKFLQDIIQRMHVMSYIPNSKIVQRNEINNSLYYVIRGYCEVEKMENTEKLIIGKDNYFGIRNIINPSQLDFTVISKTYCILVIIDKENVDKALNDSTIDRMKFSATGMSKLINDFNLKSSQTNILKNIKTYPTINNEIEIETNNSLKENFNILNKIKNKILQFFEISIFNHSKIKRDSYEEPFEKFKRGNLLHKLLFRYTILPDGPLVRLLIYIEMIITLVLLTIIPIELSLIRNTGIFTINVIIDFLFLLLIIFTKFNMAYYNEENELIIHPIYTAKNYLNNNFISDFVSIIPFELFVLYNDDYGVNNYLLILVVFRYIRLLRFHKAIKSLKSIVKDNSNLLTHVLLIFYVLIFIHIITCFIIHNSCFFADQMNSENSQQICNYGSWISNKVVDLGINNNWSVYSLAMYWTTATVTTVGYGDIIGKLDNELIFSIILMILGTMFIGHIMANEASLIVNLDNERSEYCAKSLILKDFMTYHLFPKKLIKNALDYYIYVWKRSKYANYQSIFQGFPNSMMDDLALNLYRDNLKRISIFQNADECILKTLSKICSIEFYPKNEYIVENSHITENIYFIFRGSVQISRFKSDDKTLQIGEFFGKLSGRAFKKNLFSAMAMEDCDLFVLSQDKLHFIKDYIDMENFLNENCVNELSKQIESINDANADTECDNSTKFYSCESNISNNSVKENVLMKWIINILDYHFEPESNFIILENVIMSTLIIFNYFSVIYDAAFTDYGLFLQYYLHVYEYFYLLDIIFIKSHIAYRDDGGILITDIRKIFYNYLTQPSVIIVDILPIINWEFLVCFYQYYHQLKILSYVKLVRIVRIFRVIATFKNLEQRVDVNTIYITIFKLTIYIAILAHVICCLWYWISCPVGECYPISWVNYHELESKGFRKFYAYSIALYWSFTTITTIGFGNIHAVNTTERLMSVFTMIMAKVVLTYVFSTLDSAISNNNVLHLNFTNKVFAIKNTLKNAKVDEELISLSLNHMEYKWNYIKNVSLVELISPLSYCIKCKFMSKYASKFMEKFKDNFKKICPNYSEGVYNQLSIMIEQNLFHKNQIITKIQDDIYAMYYIMDGEVTINGEIWDNTKILYCIEFEKYFETKINEKSKSRLETNTNCEILKIQFLDIANFLKKF